MNSIEKSTHIVNSVLIGNDSLYSTYLENIVMSVDDGFLEIIMSFKNFSRKSKFNSIDLVLENVTKFSLDYELGFSFQNIETYKLLKNGDSFYLSLDPDDSDEDYLETDKNIFFFKSLDMRCSEKK